MKKLIIPILLFAACRINAQDSITSVYKGNQYYQQSQFDIAESQYRKAIQDNSKSFIARFNLANALQKQKKFDESITILESLAEDTKEPSLKSSVYYNQGVAYTKSKELEKSIDSYKKALLFNPNDQE
ncbi:MAG TPA: tetratricopeptide repeat protein, partial [Flavisolibacter sp.]|nr:tetratricopeptide repeat protein [Flavisolibacter sp.]